MKAAINPVPVSFVKVKIPRHEYILPDRRKKSVCLSFSHFNGPCFFSLLRVYCFSFSRTLSSEFLSFDSDWAQLCVERAFKQMAKHALKFNRELKSKMLLDMFLVNSVSQMKAYQNFLCLNFEKINFLYSGEIMGI